MNAVVKEVYILNRNMKVLFYYILKNAGFKKIQLSTLDRRFIAITLLLDCVMYINKYSSCVINSMTYRYLTSQCSCASLITLLLKEIIFGLCQKKK